MRNKKLKLTAIGLILYLASTGISYAAFNLVSSTEDIQLVSPEALVRDEEGNVTIDPSEPKTKKCPLNGALFTKTEKTIWEKRRPLAVMIENHVEARPQSGLSFADVVYEAVAEGGITRFMGLFYCDISSQNVKFAPVRSARTYFLDWVSEYDALYNHVGGANCSRDAATGECKTDPRAQAIEQISEYGIKDMDQFGISYPTCFRNPDRTGKAVATEHTMVCASNGLYEVAKERGWTHLDEEGDPWDEDFRPWLFAEEEEPASSPDAASVNFGFWDGYKDFRVKWEYDKTSNSYKRMMGGEPHLDHETDKRLSVKNVVVQLTREIGPVDGLKHLLYETIGEGTAIIFKNGKAIEGSWEKKSRTARTLYYDETGEEISFVPGKIWIEIVPAGKEVDY